MSRTASYRWSAAAVPMVFAGLLAWPAAGAAQTLTGDAQAVRATVLGTTTTLANTGPLASASDPLEASLETGAIPSVLSGEALHAATIGWADQVASEAALGNLGLTVGGTGISADSVLARAQSVLGGGSSGSTVIDNLAINGVPVAVTGEPNQTISIPGGQVVINEQSVSASGITVNALHATVSGLFGPLADVVIASAKAGIQ
jgi:hypothetical protein